MVKISVIIPVYNVEDYLYEALDSLIRQTVFDDIEVLMIDDGSTDESRYIIEKYALDYDNFYAYHKKNEGQGATRNYGVTLAKGDYVHFMDSDDYLPVDAYEKLLDLASKNDYADDMVLGNVIRFKRYNALDSILFKNCFKDIDENISSTSLDENPSIIWDTITCNKLYKKEFLNKNDIKFLEDKTLYEDILFSLESYIRADSLSILKDVIYYWRVRGNDSSVTQQSRSIKNFKDRLKILNSCLDLMKDNNVSEEIIHREYEKWLVNDFKVHLKEIDFLPFEEIENLIDELNSFLSIIPDKIKDDQNSYLRVLYKMVENRDIDSLLKFAGLEDEIMEDPLIPDWLDEEYVKYIDFERDSVNGEFVAELQEVTQDKNNIYLEISEDIDFLPKDDVHQSEAVLFDDNDEFNLEVNGNVITVPVDLIRNRQDMHVRVIYKNSRLEHETLLINDNRASIQFDGFDVDVGIGYRRLLYLNCYEKSINKVTIDEIVFEDNIFKFYGSSEFRISEVFIQNVIRFNRIYYPVEYKDYNVSFSIPYEDILASSIKKWELNCVESLNSIVLSDKFRFYTINSQIDFFNTRDKILISDDVLEPVKGLVDLNNRRVNSNNRFWDERREKNQIKRERNQFRRENKKLTRANNRLTRENEKLNNKVDQLNGRIDEFKNRKIVKFADKLHGASSRNDEAND